MEKTGIPAIPPPRWRERQTEIHRMWWGVRWGRGRGAGEEALGLGRGGGSRGRLPGRGSHFGCGSVCSLSHPLEGKLLEGGGDGGDLQLFFQCLEVGDNDRHGAGIQRTWVKESGKG